MDTEINKEAASESGESTGAPVDSEKKPAASEAPESPENEKRRRDVQNFSTIAAQLQAQRRFAEAFEYYSRCKTACEKLSDREGMALHLKNMATMKESLAEFDPALEYYREAKALFNELGNKEEFGEIVDRIAKTLYKDRKFDEAITEYREALDFGCTGGDLHNNMGFISLASQKLSEAREFLEKAREVRTEEKSDFLDITLNNLGTVAYLEKKFEDAKKLFESALEENRRKVKDDRTIQFVVFANEKHLKEGILSFECYNDVLTRATEHLNLAATLTQLGEKEKAIEHCAQAQALDPDKPYLYLASAWLYLAVDDKDRALQYFKRVLSVDPTQSRLKEVVDTINPYAFTKIGRNELCPCGSGAKFKKCHGKGL